MIFPVKTKNLQLQIQDFRVEKVIPNSQSAVKVFAVPNVFESIFVTVNITGKAGIQTNLI